MRKVSVNLQVKLEIVMDEGVEVSEVIQEMDYDFTSGTSTADFTNIEIVDYTVTDSR